MEDRRDIDIMKRLIFSFVFIVSLVFIPRAVFGYSDETTHPALTSEVVDFYNLNFDKKITDEQKGWILEGSIEEDTPPRWINHFYDPVYNEGWTGEHGNTYLSEDFMKKFSDVFLSSESAVSAIDWVHNQKLQGKYRLYKGNQTWEKALYEYVQNGNEKEAFLALGHVLHLLEDMAVPDHTRSACATHSVTFNNTRNKIRNSVFHWYIHPNFGFLPSQNHLFHKQFIKNML